MRLQNIQVVTRILFLIGTIMIVLFLYSPAIESRFLMDDYSNLAGLSEVNKYGIFNYLLSGFAGPTGRPVSLFTFALQANAWPDSPSTFKLINLILHCINGILIFFLTLKIISISECEEKIKIFFAYFVSLIWLLHPVHLSTVFYVTQRMTELSVFFTLLTILYYLNFRTKINENTKNKSLLIAGLVVIVGSTLSVFSKENGVLTFLYIYILELTILSKIHRPAQVKVWLNILLISPLLILLAYFIFTFQSSIAGYEYRPYEYYHRLITQINVLADYLRLILFPLYSDFTFYHDDYQVIKNIFSSPLLFVKAIVLLSLLYIVIRYRKQAPLLVFGVLWFFSGHVIESSHLNLEMFFEHRNYLASYGLLLSISWFIVLLYKKFNIKSVVILFAALLTSNVIATTISHLKLWRNPYLQAVEWARLNPDSISALSDLAEMHVYTENYKAAHEIYDRMNYVSRDSVYPELQLINIASCYDFHKEDEIKWPDLIQKADTAKSYRLREITILDVLVQKIVSGNCPGLELDKFSLFMQRLILNPSFKHISNHLYEFLATIELYRNNLSASLSYLQGAIKNTEKPSYFIYEIRLLTLMGNKDMSNKKIQQFKRKYYSNKLTYLRYKNVINEVEINNQR